MLRIGIDLGGTKIEGIVLGRDGTELARRRVPTPRGDYDGTLQTIGAMVAWLEQAAGGGAASVGVAMPGAISPLTGLVKNANSTWLNGQAFDRDLSAVLARPVRVANDANCFAVSEATDGAARGLGLVFGVILGTGCGGGIAIDGRPATGRNAIAGEWGHNPLPWPAADELPGRPCYCGKHGCIETWLSGPGLAEDHRVVTGVTADVEALAAAAERGDAGAAGTLARHHRRLARALATVINVLDPDAIVIGGGLSNLPTIYRTLPGLIGEWCFSDGVSTPILPARHGDSSGVRGAAWLWPAAPGLAEAERA